MEKQKPYEPRHTRVVGALARSRAARWARGGSAAVAGDACPRDRGEIPFREDGCGGMHEGHVS